MTTTPSEPPTGPVAFYGYIGEPPETGIVLDSYDQVSKLPGYPETFPAEEHDHAHEHEVTVTVPLGDANRPVTDPAADRPDLGEGVIVWWRTASTPANIADGDIRVVEAS